MIEEIKGIKILNNVSLEKYTSYKLKEKAKAIIFPNNIDDLKKVIKLLEKSKYKIIGGGSNLIFDGDYDGYLISLENFNELKINNTTITVGAGYPLMKLAMKTSKMGLSGMEFATGIPGSVGGAVVNNSGAYKSDMGYIIKSVLVLTKDLGVKRLYNRELEYHYRTSIFKKDPSYVILEVEITLKKGDRQTILEIIQDRKKRRIESQPLEYPSAGSVFRNPEGNFAGKLIEDVGYKGLSVGGAMVSEKHANFIINKKHAKGSDIVKLIEKIKEKVKKEYNIDLILEQEIVK